MENNKCHFDGKKPTTTVGQEEATAYFNRVMKINIGTKSCHILINAIKKLNKLNYFGAYDGTFMTISAHVMLAAIAEEAQYYLDNKQGDDSTCIEVIEYLEPLAAELCSLAKLHENLKPSTKMEVANGH